jgi:hypothetical protein
MDAATATPNPLPAAPAAPAPDHAPPGNGAPRRSEVDKYDVTPLGEGYRRHRWIKPLDAEWAEYCDRIMLEHGAVRGQLVYERREQARWRGRRLMRLWEDLGLHPRWELREHVDRVRGGFVWTIEYLGRGANAG